MRGESKTGKLHLRVEQRYPHENSRKNHESEHLKQK